MLWSLYIFSPTYAGLNVDGLYRVSGNLAVIQKLRFAVNHGRDCVCIYTVIVQMCCQSVYAFTVSLLFILTKNTVYSHVIWFSDTITICMFYGHQFV